MAERSSSLVARVAAGTAVAAAAAALVAAIVSLLIADRLVRDAEDRRLTGTGAIVIREIAPHVGATSEILTKEIDEEVDELAPEGLRIAIHLRGRFAGGDGALVIAEPPTCVSSEVGGSAVRTCTVAAGELIVTVGAVRAAYDRRALMLASLLAAAVAAIAAAVVSRRTARWALEPLTRLRESLDGIVVADPGKAEIAGDDRCAEVATLRRALTDLLRRLGRSLETARRFSAEAAHELKTPLAVMHAELELLAEEEGLDPSVRETVEKLRKRVSAVSLLVERLLALAATTDRAHMTFALVALEDVAREVVERLAPEGRARVDVQADASGIVLGDETLLAALVENVVDNALKFSAKGRVLVEVSEHEDSAVIDVTDEGPGIPEELRTRAFEPFFRAPEARAEALPGHGVGLALVAQIARVHGGRAELEAAPASGRGTRVRVTLPRARR